MVIVSLFTREWIEIETKSKRLHREAVSLFTREWIEITILFKNSCARVRLPLYEGVD